MSTFGLEPEVYNIISADDTLGDTDLRLTFVNADTNLRLAADDNSHAQLWTVTGNAGGPQTISPRNTRLSAVGVSKDEFIKARTDTQQWRIVFDPHRKLYTIQTLDGELYWDSAPGKPTLVSYVGLARGTGKLTQYWIFKIA